MPKLGVYVDLNNLYGELQNKYRKKLDFNKYLKFISDIGNVEVANAYGIQLRGEAKGFIKCLESIGFNTKFKNSSNWDAGITIDVLQDAEYLNHIWLGTNSPNIIPLVKMLREKELKVIIFAANISEELVEEASQTIEIPLSLMEDKNDSGSKSKSNADVQKGRD